MKRKEFISIFPAIGAATAMNSDEHVGPISMPPFLKRGDKVAITSPAGYISLEDIQPAKLMLETWGYVVRTGNTIGKRDYTFGGTDEERLMDLQVLLDDHTVKAILCARGGYGVNRILDQLNFSRFLRQPKWVIGFSDITALHLHLLRNCHMASIHSKMCNSFPKEWETAEPVVQDTILSIRRALDGTGMKYSALPNENNKGGVAEGVLVGGNLSIIISMMGTKSEIVTDGCILILEEVGEYLYSLDRMLMTLKRSGKLGKLKGLIIGGFNKIKTDDPGEEFGRNIYEIVLSKVAEFTYPVCFDFPVGHQKNNYAFRHGAVHTLTVRKDVVELESKIGR
ncbi:MAG TPA: LD-carboxypeptidase [Chitinophagaceae bacterium]|nr:LD-carboxypeptidase [Chitinophagaceae bacterium]